VLLDGIGLKFVPVMVTGLPVDPIVGVKPEIVGKDMAVTVNDELLVAVPEGEVTLTVPVVAEEGTVTMICVGLAEAMAAVTPLNFTVSWLGSELNPVPVIVTVVPTRPLVGENVEIPIGV
jgi:hypothetical protein